MKRVKAKPLVYTCIFEILKRIALTYGYNLLLSGSLERDLDLVAIPWIEDCESEKKMIADFSKAVNMLKLDGSLLSSFKSIAEASVKTGIKYHGIYNACRCLITSHRGYKWEYTNPNKIRRQYESNKN